MYKSPIDIIHGQLETQLEGEVLRAVQKIGVDVDKDELIRALNDDRQQYEQGYRDAMASITHCKDCLYFTKAGYEQENENEDDLDLYMGFCHIFARDMQACRFCSFGTRRESDDL